MRKIRTFMDYLLVNTNMDGEHQKPVYSSIYGKIIYPVALNPLHLKDDYKHYNKPKNYDNIFDNHSRYTIIR